MHFYAELFNTVKDKQERTKKHGYVVRGFNQRKLMAKLRPDGGLDIRYPGKDVPLGVLAGDVFTTNVRCIQEGGRPWRSLGLTLTEPKSLSEQHNMLGFITTSGTKTKVRTDRPIHINTRTEAIYQDEGMTFKKRKLDRTRKKTLTLNLADIHKQAKILMKVGAKGVPSGAPVTVTIAEHVYSTETYSEPRALFSFLALHDLLAGKALTAEACTAIAMVCISGNGRVPRPTSRAELEDMYQQNNVVTYHA